ncbi:J domain-containing protein required for chloroplast accumulation response 1-like isoform X2 [Salvia hispanica]|uniref:J domain-containing protein required for chloroplast accumulation response 1-like isoform X2 n=1 Tax=Salvia hispanica TaxID=49212 RepID=UPI00200985EC|nr:J domain-containing protein required for chloroplast accumulation response 1-like isoform X2 [Salvia hispanica]
MMFNKFKINLLIGEICLWTSMDVFMKDEDGLRQSDRSKTASLKSPYTDSGGLDFGDVFGGPPRRGGGPHLHGDDFFDDIFRGHESYSSPWRTHHRHTSSFPAKSSKLVVEFPTFSSTSDHALEHKSKRFSNDKNGGLNYGVHQTSHRRNDDVPNIGKDLNSQSNRYHFSADNVKGGFAKIFNNETDLIPKSYVKMQSQSCRWTDIGVNLMENHNQKDESLRKVKPQEWPSASYARNDANCINKKNAYSSESPRVDSKILEEDSNDPFEDFFELKELHDDLEQATPCEDTIQTQADAKIRQWSAGKEGNIRSLLSTLQYVLWPGSGWQPIALVDLVEENPVKRAYQKALLRLHPDKLQQKGAASHHKYIALQVFDILQEAWDHFNNTCPI